MKIGGLQPFSLSDYPGHSAAIVFTQGCNFICPFCHNGDLIPTDRISSELIPEKTVLDFLQSRRRQLDGVVITGGEPTIQDDLLEFLHRIKGMGYRIKLDTNGSHPEVLLELLDENLLDFIAMDLKAPASCYSRLIGVKAPIKKIQESVNIIAACNIEHEFRTTLVEALLSPDDLKQIEEWIPVGSPHKWQSFEPQNALNPGLRNPPDPSHNQHVI